MELFDYWIEHPPPHIALMNIAVFLGAREAPSDSYQDTSPEQMAMTISNPGTFGGGVFPLSELPEWMSMSLAKLSN